MGLFTNQLSSGFTEYIPEGRKTNNFIDEELKATFENTPNETTSLNVMTKLSFIGVS